MTHCCKPNCKNRRRNRTKKVVALPNIGWYLSHSNLWACNCPTGTSHWLRPYSNRCTECPYMRLALCWRPIADRVDRPSKSPRRRRFPAETMTVFLTWRARRCLYKGCLSRPRMPSLSYPDFLQSLGTGRSFSWLVKGRLRYSSRVSMRCAWTLLSHGDHANTVKRPSWEATRATASCWSWTN
jgi:hypothetical protein